MDRLSLRRNPLVEFSNPESVTEAVLDRLGDFFRVIVRSGRCLHCTRKVTMRTRTVVIRKLTPMEIYGDVTKKLRSFKN